MRCASQRWSASSSVAGVIDGVPVMQDDWPIRGSRYFLSSLNSLCVLVFFADEISYDLTLYVLSKTFQSIWSVQPGLRADVGEHSARRWSKRRAACASTCSGKQVTTRQWRSVCIDASAERSAIYSFHCLLRPITAWRNAAYTHRGCTKARYELLADVNARGPLNLDHKCKWTIASNQ